MIALAFYVLIVVYLVLIVHSFWVMRDHEKQWRHRMAELEAMYERDLKALENLMKGNKNISSTFSERLREAYTTGYADGEKSRSSSQGLRN